MTILRTTLALAALLVLGACRFLPLPYELDLLEFLGDDAVGEIEAPVVAGASEAFTLLLPAEGERCHALDHGQDGVRVVNAQLRYELVASYVGPEVSGVVEIQPYLAASERALWQSALGAPIRVDLGESTAAVTDRIPLRRAQLAALNEGHGCVGLRLTGADLRAQDDGVATIAYEVRRLGLRVGFALF